jgi:hypothetical protein
MSVIEEMQFEEALRIKLEPIFGPKTQRRMDVMAMDAIRNRKRDAEILTQIASCLETK